MPSVRCLFERLEKPMDRFSDEASEDSRRSITDQDAMDLRHSIETNLERILNSRDSMSLVCEQYGLPDLSQIIRGIPERASTAERDLARCIEKYEPRLENVTVRQITDGSAPQRPMTVCFRIGARIKAEKSDIQHFFDTEVSASGRIEFVNKRSR